MPHSRKEQEKTSIPMFSTADLAAELVLKSDEPGMRLAAGTHHSFHVNRIEDYLRTVVFPAPSDLQPRRNTVSSIFFLTKGESTRSKGLDAYQFGQNTLFFLPANQIITARFISPDAEGYYCHFSLELLTADSNLKHLYETFPFLEFSGYPLVTIDLVTKARISILFDRLLVEYAAGDQSRFDILRIYLVAVFTEIKPFITPSRVLKSDAAALITERYKKALAQHIYHKQRIADYAELLAVSPNHLNKCVKKTVGKSAHDLLDDMLLLESKVLLKQTDLTVSEIAYKIGKSEISDFARFFKLKTGMKASEYRALATPR